MKRILWIFVLLLSSTSLLKAQSDTVDIVSPPLNSSTLNSSLNCLTPSVTVTATADTLCAGESVTIQASVSGNGIAAPLVAVGDILCADSSFVKPSDWATSGQTAMGVVFYVDSTGSHGWAVKVTGQVPSSKWANSYGDVPYLTDRYSFLSASDSVQHYSGEYNTQCILAAGDATQFPIAYVVDVEDGWYVPDIVQLNVLMSEYYYVNPTFQMLGFPFNMTQNYWSSTEHSSSKSWMMNVSGGMKTESKTASHLVLSIRGF